MSSKQNSTVTSKPMIPTIAEQEQSKKWVEESPSTPNEVSQRAGNLVDLLASKQNDLSTSQHPSKSTLRPDNEITGSHENIEQTAMLSARVPAHLIRKLRIRAATDGQPIQEIVAKLLRDYLGAE